MTLSSQYADLITDNYVRLYLSSMSVTWLITVLNFQNILIQATKPPCSRAGKIPSSERVSHFKARGRLHRRRITHVSTISYMEQVGSSNTDDSVREIDEEAATANAESVTKDQFRLSRIAEPVFDRKFGSGRSGHFFQIRSGFGQILTGSTGFG